MSKDTTQEGQIGQTAQTVVRESIKYRRRAQEAERRCAVLEAELEKLRASTVNEGELLQATLDDARRQIDALQDKLSELERDRDLERALVRAGAVDIETASAVAKQRLQTAAEPPKDLNEFAQNLLDEKASLRAEPKTAFSPLGTSTQSAKASGDSRASVLKKLAETATRTGRTQDILSYMRLRRAVT